MTAIIGLCVRLGCTAQLSAGACREEVGFLFSESTRRLAKPAKADQATGPVPDALEDLLNALSAVYTVFPDLWVDPVMR